MDQRSQLSDSPVLDGIASDTCGEAFAYYCPQYLISFALRHGMVFFFLMVFTVYMN